MKTAERVTDTGISTVYLGPLLKGELRRVAMAEDRSVSNVVRRAIKSYVAQHSGTPLIESTGTIATR